MKRGRVKGGAIIPATIDTGRRFRSNLAQPIRNMAGSPRGTIGGAAQNVIAITDNDLVQNGGQYKLMGGTPLPMKIVTGRRSKQGPALVVYPVDIDGNYDESFAGLVYLIRDEFTTALAAGSVNATLAEPGPGTRVVTDTNTKLSIAAGLLDSATGGAAAYDPGLWYDALARVSGRVAKADCTSQGSGQTFGWDSNQVGVGYDVFRLLGGGVNISILMTGAVPVGVGTYTLGTNYKVAVVLRAAGSFFFIQGGAEFTNWTFVWASRIGAATPLYPKMSAIDVTSIWTSDFIRVPEDTWLPVPRLSDSFNRANGALGNTDGAGHQEANGGNGVAWTNEVGTTQIAANAASASALVGGIAIATVESSRVDVIHEAELTRVGGVVGIVLRYTDAANYVYAGHDGTNAFIIKRVAGVETPVVLVVTGYVGGAVCRVICEGTSFTLYYNNAIVGTTQVIADASLQNGTECGVYSSNVGNSQDDMVTWARNIGYDRLEDF